ARRAWLQARAKRQSACAVGVAWHPACRAVSTLATRAGFHRLRAGSTALSAAVQRGRLAWPWLPTAVHAGLAGGRARPLLRAPRFGGRGRCAGAVELPLFARAHFVERGLART